MKKLLIFIIVFFYSTLIFSQLPGDIDTSFITNTSSAFYSGFNGIVNSIAVQQDGKILVGGDFINYQNNTVNRIVRINSDGSFDSTFQSGSGFNSTVKCIYIQSDGKILVGGSFSNYKGVSANDFIRLNSDGSKDSSLDIGTGFNGSVNSIAVQSDNKIILGGAFTTYKGPQNNRIIRLNVDGVRDTSFKSVSNFGFDNTVNSIVLQPNGYILVGGLFTSYNGRSISKIVRLESDGNFGIAGAYSADLFNRLSGFGGDVYSIAYNSNKIIVGGSFYSYRNVASNRIVRLLDFDGAIDNSYSIGTGFDANVNTIAVQTDGKVIVGGNFTNYKGTTVNKIVRLNIDLTIDNTFNIGTGFDGAINAIAIQSDGKILAGGAYTNYKGTANKRIIRLYGKATTQTLCSPATIANLVAVVNTPKWYLSATGGSPLALNTILTTRTYYLTYATTALVTARIPVSVIINTVSIPVGSETQSFLQGQSLSNLQVTGTNLIWYATQSDANNHINPIANNTLLIDGATYYVTQANKSNGCESAPLTVTVSSNIIQAPNASSIQNVCVDSTLNNLTATGSNIKWYNTPTGGAALLISTILINNTNYYASQTINGYESIDRTQVYVNLISTPAPSLVNGNSNYYFCGGATVADLPNLGQNLKWYIASSGFTPLPLDHPLLFYSGYHCSQTINGCESSSRTLIFVFSNPIPSTPNVAANQTVCNGATILNLVPSGSDIKWYNTPTGGVVLNNNEILIDGASYYASQISNGCESIDRAITNVQLSTLNLPPKNAGTITGTLSVCQGQTSVFYAVPIIPNASSYLWTLPTGATGTSTTNTIIVNYGALTVSGNITVKGTNTCGNGTSSSLPIIVNPLPANAGTISGNTTVCQGQTSVLYAVPSITNATSYVWTLPTGATGTSTSNSITVNYGASAVSGNIIVAGINSCGVGKTAALLITVGCTITKISLTGPGGPAPGPDWGVDYFLTDAGGGIWTANNIVLPGGLFKFRLNADWITNWGAASWPSGTGFQDGPNIPGVKGTYNVTFNQNTGDYSFNQSLSIDKEVLNNKIGISPNPTHSIINLSLNEGIIIDKVTIVDITGKVVVKQTKNLSTINVELLAKGVYVLNAYAGDKKYQEKFIKE